MFTGLIERIGTVEGQIKGQRFLVSRPSSFDDIKTGDSISVNGVCLTITDLNKKIVSFDVMQESLDRSSLRDLKKGNKVNLERALKATDRLGGHFVSGHIDYKARIENIRIESDSRRLELGLPKEYSKYIVSKGSVAVDGVSLTAGEVYNNRFSIYLIPHTLKITTLGLRKKGDFVNIEMDMLAKLKLKSENEKSASRVSMNFLSEHGFA